MQRVAELGVVPEHAEKALVVTQEPLGNIAAQVATDLKLKDVAADVAVVPDGEAAKTWEAARTLLEKLSSARLHRQDVVIAVGGGAVSDVAGFAAATYQRGIPLVLVPTTLLAQADAAVGGKNGINLGGIKNVVGCIHQPEAVIADVDVLSGLAEDEMSSGLAEVVKHGLLSDSRLLAIVTERGDAIFRADKPTLIELVSRSVTVKAGFVAQDERDHGARQALNYGHTFGHAIEHDAIRREAPMKHGEAVALGMMAAAHAAQELGWLDDVSVELHRRVLAAARLPTSARFALEDLTAAWVHDKKYRRGVRFVLLRELGRPEIGVEVPEPVLRRALERLAA